MGIPNERFFNAVASALPPDRLSRRAEDRERYASDWTRHHEPRASAVAFPRSTAEVSTLLRLCFEHEVWVVPSGGRTGLAGGAVATRGELVLSLEKMNAIGALDTAALTLHVEAGAITEAVHERCRAQGLTWPIDLAAKGSSQIGGNIATNAGGVRVIRYGPTRQWVLGLTAVTMGGAVLRPGGALEKNNTGPDLRQLLIGSEGILAVVTEAVLKLTRLPPPTSVLLFALVDVQAALRLCDAARRGPFGVTALEMFTEACLLEVELRGKGRSPLATRAPVYALLEAEPTSPLGEAALDGWLAGLLEDGLVIDGVKADTPAKARALWALRENITASLGERGLVHKDDVAVPVSALPAFVHDLQELFAARYPELELFLFGHIGDGNLHVNLPKPAALAKDAFLARMAEVDHALGAVLQGYAGSVSAEHGIGLLKKPLLAYTRSPEELALVKAIKRAFDPKDLLNPGKVIDLA
jgi:FAD/FMN-containing dehydrogenase